MTDTVKYSLAALGVFILVIVLYIIYSNAKPGTTYKPLSNTTNTTAKDPKNLLNGNATGAGLWDIGGGKYCVLKDSTGKCLGTT